MYQGSRVLSLILIAAVLSGPAFAQEAAKLGPKAAEELNQAITASALEMRVHKDELSNKEIGGVEDVQPALKTALQSVGYGVTGVGALSGIWTFLASSYIAGEEDNSSAPIVLSLGVSVVVGSGLGVAELGNSIPDRKQYVLNRSKIDRVSRGIAYSIGNVLGLDLKQRDKLIYGLKMRFAKAKQGEKIDILEAFKGIKEKGAYVLTADQVKKLEILQQMNKDKDADAQAEAAAKKTDEEKIRYLQDASHVLWYLVEHGKLEPEERERIRGVAMKNDELVRKIKGRKAAEADSDAGTKDRSDKDESASTDIKAAE